MSAQLNPDEKLGYDQWVELWCKYECAPGAMQCGARYMQEGDKRAAFIRGWNRAKSEHLHQAPKDTQP